MKNIKRYYGKNCSNFIPITPNKYIGRYPIICRSQWERSFCVWIDKNPSVVEWSSESIKIGYYDPITKKRRTYYPDYYVVIKDKNNIIVEYVIEVKPYKDTIPPTDKNQRKSQKTRLYESKAWATNRAKWRSAESYCNKMGFIWTILTEKELFGK